MTTTRHSFTAAHLLIAILTGLVLTVAGAVVAGHASQAGTAQPHVEAWFCKRC